MATETLVSFDIEMGQKVIDVMDQSGKTPNVAMWVKIPDYESWRLMIASESLDQSSQSAGYSEIIKAMDQAGIPVHRQPTISLRLMKNPMIEALRHIFASTKDVYGMRLGGRKFGDKFIEDAFVYRIR
jgi:hypothetical protein